MTIQILRSSIFHTPENTFRKPDALVSLEDGALAVGDGKILACADYAAVRAAYPEAEVRDLRGGFILPGLVDTHIHFPQTRILGGLGYSLLDWLERLALPEEARLADTAYARTIAAEFVGSLAAHGTTTALVFGAHFEEATAALFEASARRGLRVVSGLVLSDRWLRPELLQTPEAAYDASRRLIAGIGNHPRLGYAVIPRFALSASEGMLEVCGALLRENGGALFTTHINENAREIEAVAQQFPWAEDYLAIYERFGLISERAILAHNVQTTDSQLRRLAGAKASVAHCPCSNAALGSGIFPLFRHLRNNVRVTLGTDVGGGTGFGVLKEALQAYSLQRVAMEPGVLSPAQMLYLATRAGAEALRLSDKTGDFRAGKAADLVYLRRPGWLGPENQGASLATILTLADSSWVREVWVQGEPVYRGGSPSHRQS